mgnify:FL=1
MKKFIFSSIMMLFAALLVTSCGPKTPDPVKLGDSGLTSYAKYDKAAQTFFWNVTANDGSLKINPVLTAVPTAFEEFYIGQMKTAQVIFDKSGKVIAEGTNCKIQAAGEIRYISYTKADKPCIYLIKAGTTISGKDKLLVKPAQIFYQSGDVIGALNFANTDILPAGQKEIIYLTVNKKVKGKELPVYYYAAQDAKGWNLYTAEGKLQKKISPWQLKVYQKGAVKDERIEKLSYKTEKAI